MSTLPSKFTNLELAQSKGILVPSMLLVGDVSLTKQNWSEVEHFLQSNLSEFYIVRSAVSVEDSFDRSQAGVFQSSEPVAPEEVIHTLKNLYEENKKRLGNKKGAEVNLIVSPFIKSTCGGVSFYPWLYFNEHALLEFADTPQAAVAGRINGSILIDLTDANRNVNHEGILSPQIVKELQLTLRKLRNIFNYPIDVEWAYDGKNFYILQIRPITIPPQALKSVPLAKYVGDDYVINEYSETFGKLSPLSFSILETLLADASYYTDSLQIHGQEKFLNRLSTGNIVSSISLKTKYFSSKHWYSAFLRGMNYQNISRRLEQEAVDFKASSEISLPDLQYTFDRLQLAEAISVHNKTGRLTFSTSQEYEMTKSLIIDSYSTDTLANTWKKLFLTTLKPIRNIVQNDKLLAFCTLDELLHQNKDNCQTRYDQEISDSVYGVQDTQLDSNEFELLYGIHTKGKLLYIGNPENWRGGLPKDTIILVSYIPQTWIQSLPNLLGIICTSLSTLSHVAITLREYNILTIKVPNELFKSLQSKQEINTSKIQS
jgi:hypothetical protein